MHITNNMSIGDRNGLKFANMRDKKLGPLDVPEDDVLSKKSMIKIKKLTINMAGNNATELYLNNTMDKNMV